MEITLDVVMEKTSLAEKPSLSIQVGAPGPAAWGNGRWHLQWPSYWHGQHDHHGAQPGDGLVHVFERLQACM